MLKRSRNIEDSNSELNVNSQLILKKFRNENDIKPINEVNGTLVTISNPMNSALTLLNSNNKILRRSNLKEMNMMLSGHEGAIFSICFGENGNHLASSSMDGNIFLWEVFGDCSNYNVLSGHKNAVLEIKWIQTSNNIISVSADKTAAIWDANRGTRIRKYSDHCGIVNTCAISKDFPTIFATGSDDRTACIWDVRSKRSVTSYTHDYQVTSVSLSHDGQYIFTGGIDNIIRRFDIRKGSYEADLLLTGHTDTITGMDISPDGHHILSNSMDCTVRSWDIRPFAVNDSDRQENIFHGIHHGAEKNLLKASWSPDQSFVTCGSADRMVHIWDSTTAKLEYYLPGHKGSVNEVLFHPKEPIIASCSTDKQIILGELGAL